MGLKNKLMVLGIIFVIFITAVLYFLYKNDILYKIDKIPTKKPQINESTSTNLVQGLNMKITSPAFSNNGKIPTEYTCDGSNINPPLTISDVPQNAVSLALIVDDPDAPTKTWVHWIVWNIDPSTSEISENTIPDGALEGTTDFGKPGYGGPCPPSGTHHYFFKLYALDTELILASTATKQDLENSMQGHIVAEAQLIGLYSR